MMVLALVSGAAALSVSVAASDSSSTAKSQATYVCSGTNDRTQITTALSAVAAAGGGTVTLAGGTYRVTSFTIPANVVLQGAGSGSSKLLFTSRGGISMPGASAQLVGVSVSGPGMISISESHITLRDVVVCSTGLLWAAFSVEAIAPKTSLEDIEFNACQAIDCDTYGFCVSASEFSYVMKNLRFINCRAVNCGAAAQVNPWVVGFDLAERCAIDGMLVDGCYASGSYESGFHFESRPSVRNVVMRNCVSENNGLSPDALWGAGYVVGEGTVLENCRSANNQYGFFVHGDVRMIGSFDTGSETSFIYVPAQGNFPVGETIAKIQRFLFQLVSMRRLPLPQ
jgi:hypothetical protein